jgi:putative transposase
MAVKYRKALIDRRVEVVVEETVRGIGERYEIEMEALGMDKDHVHLLCGAHPKIAPGNIVMKFKSITARELFRRERWLKEELWGGSFWSSGYYVGTVGERANWAIVEKYVLEQGKRKKDLRQLTLW